MSEIHIIAHLDAKVEHRDALVPVLQELVHASRKEQGNRRYDLMEDKENPLAFVFIECWASAEAIEEHNASPHFQRFVAFIQGKVNTLRVSKLKQII